ncbi:hypothetical protein GOP47_0019459 [Adiantum capillus-veneris]|uniref:Uncharacterized protein n=1 Tax=Adiantum capillus-veneris TaxID=13818 RepID=A0A9D4Z7U9_ADICA|nr:hypothetical protein GOP47_0019459 [Adiantum capillus-veneris]
MGELSCNGQAYLFFACAIEALVISVSGFSKNSTCIAAFRSKSKPVILFGNMSHSEHIKFFEKSAR